MPRLKCTPTCGFAEQLVLVSLREKRGAIHGQGCFVQISEDGDSGPQVHISDFDLGKLKPCLQLRLQAGLVDSDPDLRMYSLLLKSLCKDSDSWSDVIALVRQMGNAGLL